MLGPWVEFDVPTFKVSEISPQVLLVFLGIVLQLKGRIEFLYLNQGFNGSVA